MHLKGWTPGRRLLLGSGLAACALTAGFIVATAVAPAAEAGGGSGNGATHVRICHATGSPDTAGNGYISIAPSASGVYHGHYRQHAADIIPPFTYKGHTYSLNWDARGQAIWHNDCKVAAAETTGSTSTTTTVATTTTTTVPVTTTTVPATSTQTVTTTTTAANQATTTQTTTAATTTTAAPAPRPGLTLTKLERVGVTGTFVRGPVTAHPGDTVFYKIVAHNSGGTQLSVSLSDPGCDAGTLQPTRKITLNPKGTVLYTCSHLLTAAEEPAFVNVATASGASVNVSASTVTAQASATTKVTPTSGVAGTQKTVTKQKQTKQAKHAAKTRHVTKKASPPKRATVRGASYTG